MIGEHWTDPYPELGLADRLKAVDRDNRWEPFGEIEVYANSGMWVADCPRVGCGGAEHLGPHPDSGYIGGLTDKLFRCSRCFAEASSVWPKQRRTIERILAERPYPQHRNWIPGVSIQDLEEANETPWHFSWTAPKTYTAGAVLTAADLNTYQRDNFLETAPAKATAGGGYIIGTAVGLVVQRQIANSQEPASEGTTSSSFTDLATAGPSVTLTTGTVAFVIVSANVTSTTLGVRPTMGWAVSGATTLSAQEENAFEVEISVANDFYGGSHLSTRTLTAGSNTFTAKYADIGGTGTAQFRFRHITVIPGN